MMMSRANVEDVKTLLFFLFILFLAILTGCNEPVRVERQDISVSIDLCSSVICGYNELCFKGECVCGDGFDRCDGQCISNESCCANEDCELSYFCNTNNECEKGCDDFLCNSNKICDDLTQECVCEPGTKWCQNQRKCISKDSCCTNLDCPDEDGCVMTIAFVTLCIDDGGMVGCEKIPEGEEKTLFANDNKYTLFVKKIYDDGKILVRVNGELIELETEYDVDADTVMYKKILKMFGGQCKL